MEKTKGPRQKKGPLKWRKPMPQKPPKVMPHGKDFRRNPKHKHSYLEDADGATHRASFFLLTSPQASRSIDPSNLSQTLHSKVRSE